VSSIVLRSRHEASLAALSVELGSEQQLRGGLQAVVTTLNVTLYKSLKSSENSLEYVATAASGCFNILCICVTAPFIVSDSHSMCDRAVMLVITAACMFGCAAQAHRATFTTNTNTQN
jgi:hypothetical protein